MTDLIERITAAIDEDERIANATKLSPRDNGEWTTVTDHDNDGRFGVMGTCIYIGMTVHNGDLDDPSQAAHIARHSPVAILRKVAAHREILELHSPITEHECAACYSSYVTYPCPTILALAKSYGIEPGV